MTAGMRAAHAAGYERILAWADLLDQINVFPVADADTGRNLKISLAPLISKDVPEATLRRRLLASATGNSGNIAVSFLLGLLNARSPEEIPEAAATGTKNAWAVLADPSPGTMLDVMDALVAELDGMERTKLPAAARRITDTLVSAVTKTTDRLPVLRQAGVVDAGALGLYIYLEGFFETLNGAAVGFRPVTDLFRNRTRVSADFAPAATDAFCVDALVRPRRGAVANLDALSAESDSIVAVPGGDCVKIHLHTAHRESVRRRLDGFGEVLSWRENPMAGPAETVSAPAAAAAIHLMTDAAGSLTRADALRHGITLLDSFLVVDDASVPETLFAPEDLYRAMRGGRRVSTAQASLFGRHQSFQSVLSRHGRVLYLCVGSAYTGNFRDALAWKGKNDPEGRFTIVDTGAASGRLGLIVLATARYLAKAPDASSVVRFSVEALDRCDELVFLDELKYLARGGRISRSRGFFGDLLNKKPVIRPMAGGAENAGVLNGRNRQIPFALDYLASRIPAGGTPWIMLEYTDNRDWVEGPVKDAVARRYPEAEISIAPLSLTSGAHMGPGTWGLAFFPESMPASPETP